MPRLDVAKDRLDYGNSFLTVVLIVGGIWQLYLLRKSIDSSEKAASAARDAADTAAQALEISQRAYVAFTDWSVETFEPNQPGTFSFTIKNIGHTPANIRNRSFVIQVTGDPTIPTLRPWDAGTDFGHMLAPQNSITHKFPKAVPETVISEADHAHFVDETFFLHCFHYIGFPAPLRNVTRSDPNPSFVVVRQVVLLTSDQ